MPGAMLNDAANLSAADAGNVIPLRTAAAASSSPAFDYRDFFEGVDIALHAVGKDGTILAANDAELKLLGYGRDEYVGRQIADFHVDQEVVADILAGFDRGEAVNRRSALLRARDGSVRHVEITSSGKFVDGELSYTRCFTTDVTDLMRARQDLVHQGDQFRQILDSLPMAVYRTDRDGKITYYNRAAAELAGREPRIGVDEWCVTDRLFTVDGKELPHSECPMAIALRENRSVRGVEAIAQRPDGSRFPFLPFPTPIHDENGELVGAVNVLVDLTDRKLADEAQQHLSAIVESSFDAIISKDMNGLIKSWNSAAERLFGYAADEAVGKPGHLIIPSDHHDEEALILERIRRGERVESFETVRQRKDGAIVPVSLMISPVRDAAGRITGASKIARDVTASKENEHRIRMLMREVNHRVKNQYSVILSMIRETNKRSESPDAFERQVRERIMALSLSHDLLVSGDWKGATVFELLLAQVKPFGNEDRVSMSGPSIILGPNVVQYLGIAFHELATNSAKYGALAVADGAVAVDWRVSRSNGTACFSLTWSETRNADIGIPAKRGFGSVVLERVCPQAVGGSSAVEYSRNGLTWTLTAPLTSIESSVRDEAAS